MENYKVKSLTGKNSNNYELLTSVPPTHYQEFCLNYVLFITYNRKYMPTRICNYEFFLSEYCITLYRIQQHIVSQKVNK